MAITTDEIKSQSLAAYNQWCKQWRTQAKENSKYNMKTFDDFVNVGVGKAVLCVANGYSLQENIETIKKYKDNVDILCCDKTLGTLIDHGIKPTYCMVCDANVDYEKYMKPWENQLDGTIFFGNVCGNPKWSDNGNWKDKYFFVNKDILKSEQEFSELSGCWNHIPAATNVSGAMVVLLTQCDNNFKNNHFGYDKILLVGFDYSWKRNNYYAFNDDGSGKDNYMRHISAVNLDGDMCFTSNNLLFSMKWLDQYIKTFQLPVVQCTKNTILSLNKMCDLVEQMQYKYKRDDYKIVKDAIILKDKLTKELKTLDGKLAKIGQDHFRSFLATT